jgi:hypothetical protein
MQVTEIRVVVRRTVQPHSFEPQQIEMTAAATLEEHDNPTEKLEALYGTLRQMVNEKIDLIMKGE